MPFLEAKNCNFREHHFQIDGFRSTDAETENPNRMHKTVEMMKKVPIKKFPNRAEHDQRS